MLSVMPSVATFNIPRVSLAMSNAGRISYATPNAGIGLMSDATHIARLAASSAGGMGRCGSR